MPKTKPIKRRFGSFWTCPNCPNNPELTHEEFLKHAKEKHGIEKGTKGKRSMIMHMDGRDWFSWLYEWEFNGLKFQQTTCQKRSKEDRMYWA